MRRVMAMVGLTAASALLVPLWAAPADASGPVRIAKIYWDSPGGDYGSNSSLNDEWIKIKNYGSSRHSLTGWKIKDADGHTFTFPTFHLDAGESVRVHSGSGSSGAHHLYWDYGNYVWTNTGDTARLKGSDGDQRDTCSYSASSPNPKGC